MPIGPSLAVGSVVDEKPLGLALDALVWPALFAGVVAIGVGQFPVGGYRYFLPFLSFLFFLYMLGRLWNSGGILPTLALAIPLPAPFGCLIRYRLS